MKKEDIVLDYLMENKSDKDFIELCKDFISFIGTSNECGKIPKEFLSYEIEFLIQGIWNVCVYNIHTKQTVIKFLFTPNLYTTIDDLYIKIIYQNRKKVISEL